MTYLETLAQAVEDLKSGLISDEQYAVTTMTAMLRDHEERIDKLEGLLEEKIEDAFQRGSSSERECGEIG